MIAADAIVADAPSESMLAPVIERGAFRPDEDETVGYWFARFLSVRGSLWSVIDEIARVLDKPTRSISGDEELKLFLAGYAAICLLVRIDRVMLFDVAGHSVIQRKLNEPFAEYRIPRKQYTNIFSSFVNERHALEALDAMRFAARHRDAIIALHADPDVGFIAEQIFVLEDYLDPSKRNYLKRAWAFVMHKWRRRGKVSAENVLAGVAEGVGRTASELYESDNKRVTEAVCAHMADFLQPGDVIVTRHAVALTNLFLPGFWPHAAFYIGTPGQRDATGIRPEGPKAHYWKDDVCVLEARKDGVRLRPLDDTLSVDMFVVLRPQVDQANICTAIERAVQHAGKMYNFDFDFFNSDRLVCTEVVYRAYDGVGELRFPLQERAGRKTLSAEDLLDFALDNDAFEPVAIFGVAGCENEVLHGDEVRPVLIESYRNAPER
jgi:hypothetical protein